MKYLSTIAATAILAYIIGLFLPWWSIAIAAFAVPILIRQKPSRSFISGFSGIFILWLLLCLVINAFNNGLLPDKVSQLFKTNTPVLILVTCIIGGLIGGLAALSASYLRHSQAS